MRKIILVTGLSLTMLSSCSEKFGSTPGKVFSAGVSMEKSLTLADVLKRANVF